MEQHPIPQDITGFQFKLVGDMTLKQFGELAFGVIMAYIFYATGWHPIIRWPLVFGFGLLGIGLAFLPIGERPLDAWIINFFKAIYRPTYFVWKREGQQMVAKPPSVVSNLTPRTTLETTPLMAADNVLTTQPTNVSPPPMPAAEPPPTPKPPPKDIVVPPQEPEKDSKAEETKSMTIEDLMGLWGKKSSVSTQNEDRDLAHIETRLNELTEKNKEFLLQIDEIRNEMYHIRETGGDSTPLQTKLDAVLKDKATLSDEIAKTRAEVTAKRVAPLTTASYQQPAVAKPVPRRQPMDARQALISLTNTPNVVNGQISDENGKPLEGVIVLIKDSAGNPIRALRSSRIGQFVASTPLSDGEYFLELEKNGYQFDNWHLNLSGQVVSPVEMTSSPAQVPGSPSGTKDVFSEPASSPAQAPERSQVQKIKAQAGAQ